MMLKNYIFLNFSAVKFIDYFINHHRYSLTPNSAKSRLTIFPVPSQIRQDKLK